MDVGLLILGLIILFGASILFKAAGFGDASIGKGTLGEAYEHTRAKPAVIEPEDEVTEQAIVKPAVIQEKAVTPEKPAKTDLPKPDEDGQVCKVCGELNPPDTPYCISCGKNFKLADVPKDFREFKTWFDGQRWQKNPFRLDVIPSLFIGRDEIIREIDKVVRMGSGHVLTSGEIGSGKTSVLRWIELIMRKEFNSIYIARPPENFQSVTSRIVSRVASKDEFKLEETSIENIHKIIKKSRKPFLLLLDEAHDFTKKDLDYLTNLSDAEGITMVFAALKNFSSRLEKETPQLLDRMFCMLELSNFTFDEAREMIVRRIENVGGHGTEPFSTSALKRIHEISEGNPRKAIKLCNSAIVFAVKTRVKGIDEKLIDNSMKDFPYPASKINL